MGVAAAVAVGFEVNRINQTAVQCGIVQHSRIEIKFHRSLGAAEIHAAFRQNVAHGAGEAHADLVAEFCNTDEIVHKVAVSGERGGNRMGVFPAALHIRSNMFVEVFILGQEETAAAERCNFGGDGIGQPFDQIQVMAALFQNMRTGNGRVAAPVTHDVRTMGRSNVFIGFQHEQIAEYAGVEDLFGFAVDGGITQHKTGSEDLAAFLVGIIDRHAIFNGGGEGFFGENMLAGLKCGNDLFFVINIGGEDHYPFHAGSVDRVLIRGTAFGVGGFPMFQTDFNGLGIGIVHRDDFNIAIAVTQQIADNMSGTVTTGQYGYFNFFIHNLKILSKNCIFYGFLLVKSINRAIFTYNVLHKVKNKMDKNSMPHDKKIVYQEHCHRLVTSPPELQRKYGFWIINASEDGRFFLPYEKCAERYFEFFSLSHLFDGGGKCWFANGNEEELVPGDWVLVAPGDIHRYGAWNGKAYVEDAIRFCGPVADRMRDVGILKSGIIHGSRMRKLLPIIALCQDPSVSAQINANISLQSLLVELYNMRESGAGGSPLMSQLLEELKQKPEHWWTVRELAEYCQLSTDQFRRNFQRYTGIPPKQYIEDLKLRQAAQLLLTCDLSVAEIAARFGYQDPFHFSRRFKLRIGVSPVQYRKAYQRDAQN